MSQLNLGPLKNNLAKIAKSKNYELLERAVATEDWQKALNLISAINAEALAVQKSCHVAGNSVNRKCWTPLTDLLK